MFQYLRNTCFNPKFENAACTFVVSRMKTVCSWSEECEENFVNKFCHQFGSEFRRWRRAGDKGHSKSLCRLVIDDFVCNLQWTHSEARDIRTSFERNLCREPSSRRRINGCGAGRTVVVAWTINSKAFTNMIRSSCVSSQCQPKSKVHLAVRAIQFW